MIDIGIAYVSQRYSKFRVNSYIDLHGLGNHNMSIGARHYIIEWESSCSIFYLTNIVPHPQYALCWYQSHTFQVSSRPLWVLTFDPCHLHRVQINHSHIFLVVSCTILWQFLRCKCGFHYPWLRHAQRSVIDRFILPLKAIYLIKCLFISIILVMSTYP